MPASGVRCTFIMNEGLLGFSETFIYNAEQIASAIEPAKALFKLRMKLCGPPVVAFRCRLSRETVRRDARLLDVEDLQGLTTMTGTISGDTGPLGQADADQPKAAIQVRMQASDTAIRNMYIAGVPDVLVRMNPKGPAVAAVAAWTANFNLWKGALIAQPWGYIGRQTDVAVTLPRKVVAWQVRVLDGLLGLTVVGNAGSFVVGGKTHARGFQMKNKAYKNPNGIHEVESVKVDDPIAGQTTIFLRGTEGIAASTIRNPGTLELVDYTFQKITSVQVIDQTTRKRGARSLSTPGRRTIRTKVSL